MKERFTALALAGALVLALAACGGGSEQAAPTPGAAESASPSPAPDGSAAPAPEGSPSADTEESLEPTRAPGSETPTPGATPSATPAQSGDPEETDPGAVPGDTVPAPGPGETPAPGEAPEKAVAAADVTAAVSAAAGVSYDDTSAYLENFYTTLDAGDVADYALFMPPMSTQIEELFVAVVQSGKLDAVKSACLDRQAAMAEDAAFYGTTGQYVDGYRLVSEGDWLLFYVGPNADAAVSAFQDAVK